MRAIHLTRATRGASDLNLLPSIQPWVVGDGEVGMQGESAVREGPDWRVERVGIVGAGAWGTALAQIAARAGRDSLIWAFEPAVARAINRDRENPGYLPGVALDPRIRATDQLDDLVTADVLLFAGPAQFCRSLCRALPPSSAPMVICSKGLERGTGALLSEVVAAIRPTAKLAILSGPSFASEVAAGMPAALTLACADEPLGYHLIRSLGSAGFRLYWTPDLIGPQIGGALKNVLAIAAGVVMGRGLGENARSALLTRGLSEMMRLGDALGAERATLSGLSGLGDLVLTATSSVSRNTTLGIALGQGRALADILSERQTVAEGVATTDATLTLAQRHHLDMPIVSAVAAILTDGVDIDGTIAALLSRPFKAED